MGSPDQEKYSESVEMYLETIYSLTEGGGKAKTTEIAREWSVTPASATEMVQKLARLGLVEYTPYHGTRLTGEGADVARSIIRKHRILQMFLIQVVGMDEEPAHDAACEMEHVLPEELEAWMFIQLGRPERTERGERIPPGPGDAPAAEVE